MSYDSLRQEFVSPSFREEMISVCGSVCSNCGEDTYIEYHHIVPLKNGGTNRLSNITPLCDKCHRKAHNKIFVDHSNAGRPVSITYEDAEAILKLYFDLQIGKKECMKLLGLAPKNKTTWYRLVYEYRDKHNIDKDFKNTIDIIESCKNKKRKK